MNTRQGTYRIAPMSESRAIHAGDVQGFELSGAGNHFVTFTEAFAAAVSMDRTCPLGVRDEWVVYVSNGSGGWVLA